MTVRFTPTALWQLRQYRIDRNAYVALLSEYHHSVLLFIADDEAMRDSMHDGAPRLMIRHIVDGRIYVAIFCVEWSARESRYYCTEVELFGDCRAAENW